ncbi:Peroxin/Dysferlin domain-containing protein [Lentinula raphanica]|uniref:Peroxin/Dysferlin domain-containing protein n=1 Tax=Lentinula raphanica TaxID=153919 RepID=A0AA38P9M4_9AGAR|nr:Peroxin/Dysferlin domain-containing protein [Lentinula raphanica]KAJ3974302.1 Peroxin/Dysferlin domain-containing protein [Lentinula raphanica]
MSSSATTTTTTSLHEFTNTVPFSLTSILVRLGPYISLVKNALEILTWSRPTSYDSWLALAAWWAVCLLSYATLRYFLPIAILLSLTVTTFSTSSRFSAPLVTEVNLQTAISDLATIQSLIRSPGPRLAPSSCPAFSTLLRVSTILYPPYLLLTYYVPLQILISLAGTVALTWNSPWASVIRTTLYKSAWVRWTAYYIQSKLTGQPLPPRNLSYQTLGASNSVEPGTTLRFLFTIYENQRWWMGLDFSPALLPNERPSWCSVSLQPVSPPAAFTLPEPTSVYLHDSHGRRVKRTATWKWEEPEWRVLVKKEDGAVSRVERPVPAVKEESSSLLMKAAGKMKEVNSPQSPGNAESDHQPPENDEDEAEEEDIATDADGWVYGDNKWEARSNKGGMGKYTRYRRWTRVAIVNEVVEIVEDGDTGIDGPDRGRTSVAMVTATSVSSSRTEESPEVESPLRQRLKSALSKGS